MPYFYKLRSIPLFFILCLSIALWAFYVVVYYNYFPIKSFLHLFIIWSAAKLVGTIFIGGLSDIFSRKKIFLLTQIFGVFGFILSKFLGLNFWITLLTVLTFNPAPVAKAALVDNFYKIKSRILFSFAFIVQIIPWLFFPLIHSREIDFDQAINGLILVQSINIILTYFFYKEHKLSHEPISSNHIQKKSVLVVVIAFLFAQIIFFLIDISAKIDQAHPSSLIYFLIQSGALLGCCIHVILYRGHSISYRHIISYIYAIGTVLFMTLLLTVQLLTGMDNRVIIPFIAIMACLGGFYIPIVFSHIVMLLKIKNRGFACGLLEASQGLAAILALFVFKLLDKNLYHLVIVMTILYLLSLLINNLDKGVHKEV